MSEISIIVGDAKEEVAKLAEKSIHCCVTSPPYFGLRDYGTARWEGGDPACDHIAQPNKGSKKSTLGHHGKGGSPYRQNVPGIQYRGTCKKCGAQRVDHQIGLEDTPQQYIESLVNGVFAEVHRALRDDGTLWLVVGDSYASTWSCGRRNTVGAGACDYGARQTRTGNGIKEKDLMGIPWALAFALRDAGWYLRRDVIWHKTNGMPESTDDRPTSSHEYVFMLTKSARYYYDGDAIKEPLSEGSIKRLSQANLANQRGSDRAHAGARSNGPMKPVAAKKKKSGNLERKHRGDYGGTESNSNMGFAIPWEDDGTGRSKRSVWHIDEDEWIQFLQWKAEREDQKRDVWSVSTKPYREAHFATYPPDLIEPCILASSPRHGTVLDPFTGSGTTGLVCSRLERNFIGVELNPKYARMARRRIESDAPLFDSIMELAGS